MLVFSKLLTPDERYVVKAGYKRAVCVMCLIQLIQKTAVSGGFASDREGCDYPYGGQADNILVRGIGEMDVGLPYIIAVSSAWKTVQYLVWKLVS